MLQTRQQAGYQKVKALSVIQRMDPPHTHTHIQNKRSTYNTRLKESAEAELLAVSARLQHKDPVHSSPRVPEGCRKVLSLHFGGQDVYQWFPVRLQNVLNTFNSQRETTRYSADHIQACRASARVWLKCLLLT